MEKPNPTMCHEWRHHPVTKYLLASIDETITSIQAEFGAGAFIGDTEHRTLELSFKGVGMCKALDQVREEIETIAREDTDD